MKTAMRIVGIVMGTFAAMAENRPALAQLPCQYEIVATIQGPDCGITGITGLVPEAISPNGLYVTGWYAQCDTGDEAFLWIGPPPGTLFTIPRPGGVVSARGYDVNDSGMVTGIYDPNSAGLTRSFVWKHQAAQWIDLPPPQPNGHIQASAINNANTVVGYRSIRNDVVPREAFIWNESTGFEGLGVMNGPSSGAKDISENGIVVGWTGTGPSPFYNNVRAFIYQAGKVTVLDRIPGGITSMAFCVNATGDVVIAGKISSTVYAGFFYHEGAMIPISLPAGFDDVGATSLTDTGLAVGACGNVGSNISHPCAWIDNQPIVLDQVMVSPPTVVLGSARGASLDGSIVVHGTSPPPQNVYELGFILRPVQSVLGDTNCDQHVNIDDLLGVIVSWGPCAGCPTDFDTNGQVNIDDLLTVITHWSP